MEVVHFITREASLWDGTPVRIGQEERVQHDRADALPRSRGSDESSARLVQRMCKLGEPILGQNHAVGVEKAEPIVW